MTETPAPQAKRLEPATRQQIEAVLADPYVTCPAPFLSLLHDAWQEVLTLEAAAAAREEQVRELVEAVSRVLGPLFRHPDFSDAKLPADYRYDEDIAWSNIRAVHAALAALTTGVNDDPG